MDLSVAFVFKSGIPLKFYWAAISKISDTFPYKFVPLYYADSLVKVTARINQGHSKLFHRRVPIDKLKAILLSFVSLNVLAEDGRSACSPNTSRRSSELLTLFGYSREIS
jgi:hypothetical protein